MTMLMLILMLMICTYVRAVNEKEKDFRKKERKNRKQLN